MPVGVRFIEQDIDGSPVKFHKMTPYDRMEVIEKCRKEWWGQREDRLKRAEAKPDQLYTEQEAFDEEFRRRDVILDYIREPAGRVETFMRSLKYSLSEDAAKEALKKFTPDEDGEFALAVQLWGIKLKPIEPPKSAEDNSSYGDPETNPQKPEEESYQTPPATTTPI